MAFNYGIDKGVYGGGVFKKQPTFDVQSGIGGTIQSDASASSASRTLSGVYGNAVLPLDDGTDGVRNGLKPTPPLIEGNPAIDSFANSEVPGPLKQQLLAPYTKKRSY